jgi:hypothetical protein
VFSSKQSFHTGYLQPLTVHWSPSFICGFLERARKLFLVTSSLSNLYWEGNSIALRLSAAVYVCVWGGGESRDKGEKRREEQERKELSLTSSLPEHSDQPRGLSTLLPCSPHFFYIYQKFKCKHLLTSSSILWTHCAGIFTHVVEAGDNVHCCSSCNSNTINKYTKVNGPWRGSD